jgi:hypothetical protein
MRGQLINSIQQRHLDIESQGELSDTKRLSWKLNHPKLGPFIIEEKLGPVNY